MSSVVWPVGGLGTISNMFLRFRGAIEPMGFTRDGPHYFRSFSVLVTSWLSSAVVSSKISDLVLWTLKTRG